MESLLQKILHIILSIIIVCFGLNVHTINDELYSTFFFSVKHNVLETIEHSYITALSIKSEIIHVPL